MIDVSLIAVPLAGAAIGLVTNEVAIKMLFRPKREYRIGSFRVPFTPGLIPKEKSRIARGIAAAVAGNLLSYEVLHETLVSDEFRSRVRGAALSYIEKNTERTDTLDELLCRFVGKDSVDALSKKLSASVGAALHSYANGLDVGMVAANAVREHIKSKLSGGIFASASALLDSGAFDKISRAIADSVNQYVDDNIEDIAAKFVFDEIVKIRDKSLGEVLQKAQGVSERIADAVDAAYMRLIEKGLRSALSAVDLERIIYERIDAFSAEEFEKLVMELVHKELSAIVWLGGLLGLLMGIATVFIR